MSEIDLGDTDIAIEIDEPTLTKLLATPIAIGQGMLNAGKRYGRHVEARGDGLAIVWTEIKDIPVRTVPGLVTSRA